MGTPQAAFGGTLQPHTGLPASSGTQRRHTRRRSSRSRFHFISRPPHDLVTACRRESTRAKARTRSKIVHRYESAHIRLRVPLWDKTTAPLHSPYVFSVRGAHSSSRRLISPHLTPPSGTTLVNPGRWRDTGDRPSIWMRYRRRGRLM
jgi:hypothetical protein